MKYFLMILPVVMMAVIQGCSYPDPALIEQKDIRPAIGVSGAPKDAVLYVDGLRMGPASQYDGEKNVLLVENGKHTVEVKSAAGGVLMSETVFLGSSVTKVFNVKP